MLAVLTGFHVLVCMGLIVVVLLQTGRGTGMASVFGGGGGGSVMGGKGFGGVLAKATATLAIVFMLMSITLSLMPRGGGRSSVFEERERPAQQPTTEMPVDANAVPASEPAPETPGGTPSEAPAEVPPETPAETPGDTPSGE
jgi:preprotein translocase subunit SecG